MMDGPVVVLKHGVIFEAGFWRDFGREVDRHLFAELLNAALTGERLMAQKYHTCDVEDPNYPSKFLEELGFGELRGVRRSWSWFVKSSFLGAGHSTTLRFQVTCTFEALQSFWSMWSCCTRM